MTRDDKLLLMKSGRRYENLEVAQYESLIRSASEILAVPGRKWKQINIRSIDFETMDDVIEFLSIIEPTLQELTMDGVYINSNFRRLPLVPLHFPHLKVLETKCCYALLYHEAFVNCKNLTTFVMKSGSSISQSAFEAIKAIMTTNVRLKKLGIHFNVFNLIFNEDIAEPVGFKLEEFHADHLYRVPGVSNVESNFRRFLVTQMATLQVLTVGDWMGLDVLKTIFHMKQLKNLTVKGIHLAEASIEWEDVELQKNDSIIDLNISDMSNRLRILKMIIRATPNLKSLKLYSMDQKAMELVGLDCKSLTSLHVDHFHATNVSDARLFNGLEEFSAKKIWQSFDVDAGRNLTHFEKLVPKGLKLI